MLVYAIFFLLKRAAPFQRKRRKSVAVVIEKANRDKVKTFSVIAEGNVPLLYMMFLFLKRNGVLFKKNPRNMA